MLGRFWSVLLVLGFCLLFAGRFWSIFLVGFYLLLLFLVGFIGLVFRQRSDKFHLFLNIWSVFLTKNGIGFHAFALCSNFVFCFDFNPLKIP